MQFPVSGSTFLPSLNRLLHKPMSKSFLLYSLAALLAISPTHLFAATGDGPGGFNKMTTSFNICIPLVQK
jgi:hypothetical protein